MPHARNTAEIVVDFVSTASPAEIPHSSAVGSSKLCTCSIIRMTENIRKAANRMSGRESAKYPRGEICCPKAAERMLTLKVGRKAVNWAPTHRTAVYGA